MLQYSHPCIHRPSAHVSVVPRIWLHTGRNLVVLTALHLIAGTPLFGFGFGLSYTEFDIKWQTPPPALTTVGATSDSATTYKVTVKNIGAYLTAIHCLKGQF